jgi:hypothetical protein
VAGDPELRGCPGVPLQEGGHLVGGPVDDVDGQFRHVVEGAADLSEGSADVEVALLDLRGEVALADRDAIGIRIEAARRRFDT